MAPRFRFRLSCRLSVGHRTYGPCTNQRTTNRTPCMARRRCTSCLRSNARRNVNFRSEVIFVYRTPPERPSVSGPAVPPRLCQACGLWLCAVGCRCVRSYCTVVNPDDRTRCAGASAVAGVVGAGLTSVDRGPCSGERSPERLRADPGTNAWTTLRYTFGTRDRNTVYSCGVPVPCRKSYTLRYLLVPLRCIIACICDSSVILVIWGVYGRTERGGGAGCGVRVCDLQGPVFQSCPHRPVRNLSRPGARGGGARFKVPCDA